MSPIPFSQALKFWLKLGFISFGGPAGQISIMHEELVTRKKWVDEQRFHDALSFCTLLPGPEAQQLATYLGWLMHGVKGGVAAGLLFIFPSVLILLGLSILYVTLGNHPISGDILLFLRPAVLAIIVSAFYRMAVRSLKHNAHYAAAFSAFILMTFFNFPFPFIIIAALVAGWLIPGNSIPAATPAEIPEPAGRHSGGAGILLSGFALWLLPMAFVILYNQDFTFWSSLSLFFTKAACITFGGAYAVLPYVADKAVNDFEWLTSSQMVDGLALGETTPGPLIMVLAFVGFMAGYGTYGGSLAYGTAGLLITTWYTFLPGFIFVLMGAPYVSRISASGRIRKMMLFVSAAVTGVILNLAYHFSKVILKDPLGNINWLSVLIFGAALTLLQRKIISIPWLVLLTVISGVVWNYLGTKL